jgi:hypothetical protein
MGRRRKNPEVILTLDFGGSGLKCLYQVWGGERKVLFMEAFVIEAEAESLKEKTQGILGSAYPENMAWVGVEGNYRAIGYFASVQYNAISLLKPKKHSLAVYRTLAAVWVIQQRLKFPKSMVIAMAVLLPPGELSDSQMFLKNLKEALRDFETPTGTLNVKTTDLICYPEGSGVYFMHCHNSGEIIKKKVFALIMLGYRNASVLLSRKGMVTEAESMDLGMIRYLELIMKKTSGLKPEQIVKAISKASASNPLPRDFLNLTELNLRMDLRKEQAEQIVEAVIHSKQEYLTAIQGWFSEVLPSELEEVVFCGGTVDYFKQELDSLFPATPVKWHGNFDYPEELEEQWLGNRLADAYGLSLAFTQEINKKYRSLQKSVA